MSWRAAPYDSSPSRSVKRQRLDSQEPPSDLFKAPYTPPTTASPPQAPLQTSRTVELVQEQQEALRLILSGGNVFLTGEAGSGKTEVLKRAISGLRDQGKHVRITAPTGKAACGVGGRTLHNLLGLTPKKMQLRMDQLQDLVVQHDPTRQSLEEMNVLIIEEISMVENVFLERINRMIQTAKDNDEPFGGVQIIVCGDFRQLSPVKPFRYCFNHGGITTRVRSNDRKIMVWACSVLGCEEERPETEQWAFVSEAWKYAEFTNVNLTHNHRQRDEEFVAVLRKLARGDAIDRKGRDLLYHHPHDVTAATYLFPTNQEVKEMNSKEFDKLHGAAETYRCLDHFWWDTRNEKYRYLGAQSPFGNTLEALHDHQYEPVMQLKVDEPVVLLTNLDVEKGLVNGSQGRIKCFQSYVETRDHSGSGVDHSVLEAGSQLGEGSQQSINIKGAENSRYRYLKVKEFCTHGRLLPVVEFNNGITTMILPDCSLTQLGDEYPYTLLSRTQIPLIAAWAMSVHKAQGMTMDNVVVDLSKAFCTGQAYVALSRARSLEGLRVEGSEAGLDKTAADPVVKHFMETTGWHRV